MRHVFYSLLALCFGIAASQLAMAADQLMRVEARAIHGSAGPIIEFTLTNMSSKPIDMLDLDVPWIRTSTDLVALPSGGVPLPRRITSEDSRPPNVRTVRQGETIVGQLSLCSEFQCKDVEKALQRGRMIVFWHYAPRTDKRDPLGEYGGWISLSKSDL